MNLAVIGDRVLVRCEKQQEYTTPSGIVVVEDYAPNVVGVVAACGEGLDVRPEDVVIFAPTAGQLMDFEAERFLVLDHDEILAVVE